MHILDPRSAEPWARCTHCGDPLPKWPSALEELRASRSQAQDVQRVDLSVAPFVPLRVDTGEVDECSAWMDWLSTPDGGRAFFVRWRHGARLFVQTHGPGIVQPVAHSWWIDPALVQEERDLASRVA